MRLNIPEGYDYDLCSSEIVLQMQVSNGRIVLPSGMSYRYLLMPDSDRMTLPMARKIKELVDAGARVIAQKRLKGSPGLTHYPQGDSEIKKIAAELSANPLPDSPIPRRVGKADLYFVSNPENRQQNTACTFRVAKKIPELWAPETGVIRILPEFTEKQGRITVPLHFEPMQSWFVVFRKSNDAAGNPDGKKNFITPGLLREITGEWQVRFDPKWGGPERPIGLDKLTDWSKHSDPKVYY